MEDLFLDGVCVCVCGFKRECNLTGLCPVDLYSSVIDGVGRQRWRVVGNPRHGYCSYNFSRRVAQVIIHH